MRFGSRWLGRSDRRHRERGGRRSASRSGRRGVGRHRDRVGGL